LLSNDEKVFLYTFCQGRFLKWCFQPVEQSGWETFGCVICAAFDDYTGELFQYPVIEKYKIVKFPAKVFLFISL
jgi:hypothetical protein